MDWKKEQFVFECKGLEKLKVNEPIKFYTVDYTKTNRKDLEKLYDQVSGDELYKIQCKIGDYVHNLNQ